MATVFHIRIKCICGEDEWHYHREEQAVLDDTIVCPTHPECETKDFIIESKEEIVE